MLLLIRRAASARHGVRLQRHQVTSGARRVLLACCSASSRKRSNDTNQNPTLLCAIEQVAALLSSSSAPSSATGAKSATPSVVTLKNEFRDRLKEEKARALQGGGEKRIKKQVRREPTNPHASGLLPVRGPLHAPARPDTHDWAIGCALTVPSGLPPLPSTCLITPSLPQVLPIGPSSIHP